MTPVARWEEALDAQLDLYTFANSERGRRYILGWQRAELETGHLQVGGTEFIADRVAQIAFLADPVWIDPDLQTVWEAAVPTFEPEALHPQDLIVEGGFAYLPRPHFTTDIHGRQTSFRAFAWGTTLLDWNKGEELRANFPGVLLMMFHQLGDRDDYDTGSAMVSYDKDGAPDLPYSTGQLRRGDLILDFVYPWPYGAIVDADGIRRLPLKQVGPELYVHDEKSDYGVAGSPGAVGKLRTDGPDNIEKHVQCLWRLMAQTIATRTQVNPSRPVRRRLERAKVDARRITVIALRRPSSPGTGEHRTVEWSHRWLVAGHWRKQWYPSIGTHRQIWISPYVKGPEEAPLEVRKARVFELVR